MSNVASDLAQFHQFIGARLGQGDGELTPEEALELWRSEHPGPDNFEDSVAAIQEALDDVAAGDCGRPFDVFDREFRGRHNLPETK
jgi:hypothetical protein